jgi:hypothetical protein
MLSTKPEDIAESDLESLYEVYSRYEWAYESEKYKSFVNSQQKHKRADLFRFIINRSVEPSNNKSEGAIRPVITYHKL